MASGAGGALAAVLVLAFAGPVLAEDPNYGRFRLGPFYFTPKVTLARYSGVNTAGSGAPGELPADTTTTLSPSLDAVIPIGRRLRLKGGTSAYFNPFRRGREPVFVGFGGWGGGELDLGPLGFFGTIGGGQAKERVSFDLEQRVRRSEGSKAGGVTLRLGRRITASASRTDRASTYDQADLVGGKNVGARLDREATTVRYDATCALTGLTSLRLSADVIDDRFLGDDLEVRSYRYVVGFEFSPLAFIRGRVAAGYRKLADGQGVPGYTGSTISIAATIPLSRFGTLTGTSDRDITYALTAGGERSTFLVNRYRGEVRVGLPLNLIAAPFYSSEQARNLGGVAPSSPTKLHRYGGSLFRAFGRPLRIGGTVEALEAEGGGARQVSYFLTAEWTP